MSKGIIGALLVAGTALTSTAWAQDDAPLQETGDFGSSSSRPRRTRQHASSAVGPLRINGGLHFGFGGELSLEIEDVPGDVEDDLKPTIGMQLGADYVLMDYVSIGGEARLAWITTDAVDDADGDRAMVFDLNVKPKVRYALSELPLEVYGTLPFGLSVFNPNDDWGIDGGAGFNLGIGAGATYFFNANVGVNTEMLGVIRWLDGEASAFGVTRDADLKGGQFTWFLNAVYAL